VKKLLGDHGIYCTGKTARQLTRDDYNRFDLLIGMDDANVRNMCRMCGGDPQSKIKKLLDYTDNPQSVADPWYTGNFLDTWRDVQTGCRALLDKLA
ncbi:MAG: low molecular weight phosphotyrosine protein phosphatase, partial [Bacteroidales bacterium]|nr:low molecular weight phosphotyrosine protein phosphatase [Bacteroidales bacterium]